MIRSILIPLDGSRFGEQVLPLALDVARRAKARVELIHVHQPLAETYAEMQVLNATLEERVRANAQEYLSGLVRDLGERHAGKLTALVKDGQVATTVREHAEKTGVDLVALTTHARGALGRFWMGSTADTLIREVRTPLLLVPPVEKPAATAGFKRILIPLDGTPLAEEILPAATALGRLFEAEYTLLRVIQPLFPTEPFPLGTAGGMAALARAEADEAAKIHEQITAEAKTYLEEVAARLRQEGLQVKTQVAMEGQPARAILSAPEVDLIAMVTHGRHGLSRFFRGSVADKVLRGATVPMLVQRPKT
jgi:nucleotide-binding universal stress UspA family protein